MFIDLSENSKMPIYLSTQTTSIRTLPLNEKRGECVALLPRRMSVLITFTNLLLSHRPRLT